MKVKVGVIGLGFMGSAHARVYNELKDCELLVYAIAILIKSILPMRTIANFLKILKSFLGRTWMR